jgi:hypothetical protein
MKKSEIKNATRFAPAAFCIVLAMCAVSCANHPAAKTPVKTLEASTSDFSAAQTNGPAVKSLAKNYYTCGMHPEVHSQDPDGKCPICGMPLLPASEVPDEPMNQ